MMEDMFKPSEKGEADMKEMKESCGQMMNRCMDFMKSCSMPEGTKDSAKESVPAKE